MYCVWGLCVNCTLYYYEGRGNNQKKSAHILIKVAHCDGMGEWPIKRVVALIEVLYVVVLRWTILVRWSLKLEWMATYVCGCARALLVGGGEAFVEARERDSKIG